MVLGSDVMYGFHGEFWKGSEANQFLHFNNGLFVGQFGTPNRDYHILCGTLAGSQALVELGIPGKAGNSLSLSLAEHGGVLCLYHNDEGNHGGVQQVARRGQGHHHPTHRRPVARRALSLLDRLACVVKNEGALADKYVAQPTRRWFVGRLSADAACPTSFHAKARLQSWWHTDSRAH